LHKEYLEILEKEITRPLLLLSGTSRALFQNISINAEAYVKQGARSKTETPKRAGARRIYEVRSENRSDHRFRGGRFRQEVIAYLWAANAPRCEKIDYRSYEPLKEAIEKS